MLLLSTGFMFSASIHADFYNKDCENLLDQSYMFSEQSCTHRNVSAGILWTEQKICQFSVDCVYPEWHPKAGAKTDTGPVHMVMVDNISKMRWCLDGSVDAIGEGVCTPLNKRNYTNEYMVPMLHYIVRMRNLYPGECGNDPDADTHWCRWNEVYRRIGAGNYRSAYEYAKNIADTRGWGNWKKLVELLEG